MIDHRTKATRSSRVSERTSASSPAPSGWRYDDAVLGETSRISLHLAGLFVVLAVLGNLGAPVPGATYLVHGALVLLGYSLAKSILGGVDGPGFSERYVRSVVNRLVLPTFIVVAVASIYLLAAPYMNHLVGDDLLSSPSSSSIDGAHLRAIAASLTFTLNLFGFLDGVSFPALRHLWIVALIGQFTIVAPMLVLGKRQRVGRGLRAVILLILAISFALVRIVLTATGAVDVELVLGITSFDGLLVGLGLGVMPLAVFNRHPVTRMATPALFALCFVAATPLAALPMADTAISNLAGRPLALLQIGLLVPAVIVLTSIVLWAEVVGRLPKAVRFLLLRPGIKWLSARAFGLYLWHLPFQHLVQPEGSGGWLEATTITVVFVLALSASCVLHRSTERRAIAATTKRANRYLAAADRHPAASETAPSTQSIQPMQPVRGRQPNVA